MLSNPVSRFRLVSILEGLSFIVLLTGSVLKRTTEIDIVPVMGMVHGVLFIAYLLVMLDVRSKLNWDGKTTGLAVLASVLPFGPFVFDYAKRDQLRAGERAVAAA
jgi:integral membrane protein